MINSQNSNDLNLDKAALEITINEWCQVGRDRPDNGVDADVGLLLKKRSNYHATGQHFHELITRKSTP